MRFYLSRIGERSLSYQVSGDAERLVEVRALNGEGRPLHKGWRMSAPDDGRTTQQYRGAIQGVEIHVAEEIARHEAAFRITGLFAPSRRRDARPSVVFAPAPVDPTDWGAYAALDMGKLDVGPEHWQVYGGSRSPVAEARWPEVSMYLTHSPTQWGNAPQAHVYFPMLPGLPAALSAFSYRVEHPAGEQGSVTQYARIAYPYRASSGQTVVRHRLAGRPVAVGNWTLRTGLGENERLEKLAGKLIFRLPLKIASTELALDQLWQGQTHEGVTVRLTEVGRGMFPGYRLRIDGDVSRLINLYGVGSDGRRVAPDPVNYQEGGYWTMTLPFGEGIEYVELVLATAQEVREYPFALRPEYPQG
jgi:hypothetical protein